MVTRESPFTSTPERVHELAGCDMDWEEANDRWILSWETVSLSCLGVLVVVVHGGGCGSLHNWPRPRMSDNDCLLLLAHYPSDTPVYMYCCGYYAGLFLNCSYQV